jgi:glycosyltransferase involved in cell wall biosynthesis
VEFGDRLAVIPPWPHEHCLAGPKKSENPFVLKHNLADKFVIMYSGNHSPSNPLDTLLLAAERLKDDSRLMFLFVGGGVGKKAVERFVADHGLKNALCLPYQPMSELGNSLSSGDVHVVSLGAEMVGIIHPCKVYGAMAVARPVLYLGPTPSHVSDILEKHELGFSVEHGDVDGAVKAIERFRQMSAEEIKAMGDKAQEVLRDSLSQKKLCGEFCDRVEAAFGFTAI